MSDKRLDFLVIGAQKSGTSSLHEYLYRHPQIQLPAGKEVPFFNLDHYYQQGITKLLDDHFPNYRSGKITGKVSPQYMTNQMIVERIHANLPDIHLLAILRDPIKRAISHYKMACRRGQEKRTIEKALSDTLRPSAIANSRELPAAPASETQCYLAWSEYGRILSYYYERYPSKQLKILFFEDLVSDPGSIVDEILLFLDISPGYRPKNLGKPVFSGGTTARFPNLRESLRSSRLKSLWEKLPPRYQAQLSFTYERLNAGKNKESSITLSDTLLAELSCFFQPDIMQLERLIAKPVPWEAYRHECKPS